MRVTVLGAGVIGLTTAVSLLDAGCEVRVVTAAPVQGTTSYLAAAVWFPTHVGPPGKVADWGRRTFEVLAGQARDRVPGVYMRESLALYRSPPGPVPWAATVGGVRTADAVELPPGYACGLRFVVPLVEMPLYLPWLEGQVRERGGEVIMGRVGSLGSLGSWAGFVVNCSGLGARELAGDLSVYPVRGQIVRVTNPGLDMSVRDEFHPGGRAYVHPRTTDCILGGTLDENQWDTTVDMATAGAIIARCTDIVPGIAGAEVIEHLVGLRPGRPQVRLESDTGDPRVIHNYGHGGAGVTLCWGCAQDVVGILLR